MDHPDAIALVPLRQRQDPCAPFDIAIRAWHVQAWLSLPGRLNPCSFHTEVEPHVFLYIRKGNPM